MTKTRQSKIIALAVVFLLVLSAIFGVGLSSFSVSAASGNNLRFKDISAGEDFVIGLTYDNELYGWSLGAVNPSATGGARTLGNIYSDKPERIEVTLDGNETIVKIAATRSAAAFYTTKKVVYTWGKDGNRYESEAGVTSQSTKNHLLLRGTSSDPSVWYTPSKIDYYTTNYNAFGVSFINPENANRLLENVLDLVGGEYNFTLQFTSSNGTYYYYTWGSSLFNLTVNETTIATSNAFIAPSTYAGNSAVTTAQTLYAGGNTVGIVDETKKLFLRGKNYFIPSTGVLPSNYSSTGIASGSAINYFETESTTASLANALIGGHISDANARTGSIFAKQGDLTYAANQSISLVDGKNEEFVGATAAYAALSLGNGYGYGISGNLLKFWGNSIDGQSGAIVSTPDGSVATIADSKGTPKTVAAGRTFSGAPIQAVFAQDKLVVDSGAFLEKYRDTDVYLTGLVTSSGIFAWNKNIHLSDAKSELTDNFSALGVSHDSTAKNYIATLKSGYGNNLFAISNLGKVYRVVYDSAASDFKVTVYDAFKNIVNWDVVAAAQTVQFNLSNERDASDLKSASVAYDKIAMTADTGKINGSAGTKSFIAADNIKDNYRILRPDEDAAAIDATIFKSDETVDVDFMMNGVSLIDNGTLYKYLDWEFVSSSTPSKSVEIKITPFQRTPSKITMSFFIGRYDNFTINLGDESFYDYKKVAVDITIDNTAMSTRVFDGYTAPTGKAVIPLLDPNNPYNDSYSIAAMDVSGGLKQLATLLVHGEVGDALTGEVTQINSLNDKFVKAIALSDKGFPSSAATNAALGDDRNGLNAEEMAYYGLNSSYFNDKYLYFAADRDGDKVTLSNAGLTVNGIKYTFKPVEFSVNLSSTDITNYNYEKLKGLAEVIFNNLYGLKIKLEGNSTDAVLTISYDVLELTAEKSTNSVKYAATDVGFQVDSWTVENGDNVKGAILLSETSFGSEQSPNFYVHSQGSAMMKDDPQYYGNKADNKNQRTITVRDNLIVADSVKGTYKFDLSSYFKDTSNLYYTHGNSNSPAAYDSFKSTFVSASYTVTMSEKTLIVEPRTTQVIEFIAEVMRFDNGKYFGTAAGSEQEIIQIHYILYPSPSDFMAKNPVWTVGENGILRSDTTINITDVVTGNAEKNIFINAYSSSPNVLRVTISADGKSLALKTLKSGKVIVTYFARQVIAGQAVGIPITQDAIINVESMVTLDEEMALLATSPMYVSELADSIKTANPSLPPEVIASLMPVKDANDKIAEGASYYFMKQEGVDSDWVVSDAKPDFIYSVVYFSTNNYFELKLGSYDSADTMNNYKIVFRLKSSALSDKEFLAAVVVRPAKIFIKDTDGSYLNINIDVRNLPTRENNDLTPKWYGDSAGQVIIPVKFLTSKLSSILGSGEYRINQVTPSDGSSQYFTHSANDDAVDLVIRPKYPVSERQTIEISVKGVDNGSTYILSFGITITGIIVSLDKPQYNLVFIIVFFSVLAVLIVVFIIRMGLYWKKKAEQKRIIRKNQTLIKMRDKMHNKTTAATREELVKTKLKMEDPKYAKMFNELRKTKEEESGITLDSSVVANKAERKASASEKASKKKGGKKSIDELKAELAAKKAAFEQMQMGGDSAAPMFEPEYNQDLTREDIESQIKAKMGDDDTVLFDVTEINDNNGFN